MAAISAFATKRVASARRAGQPVTQDFPIATNVCYRCRVPRDVTAFIRKRNGQRYEMCSVCLSEVLRPERNEPKARLRHTASHRTCYLCRRILPNDRFTRRTAGTFFSACKDCNRNVFAQRRRAQLLAAPGYFTTAEWEVLLALHPKCPDCKRVWEEIPLPPGRTSAVTRDHIVPISRGGSNFIDNIRPLCYSCNSRKGHRPCRVS